MRAPVKLTRIAKMILRSRRQDRRRAWHGRDPEAGFTLVEVIVALAMLSLGLGLLLGLLSSSLRQTANAERMAEASSLVQSLLDRIGSELPIAAAERDGEFPNGYHWHLQVFPYGDPTARDEWPVGIYAVSTEVAWQDGRERRSVLLTTLRLGPKAARP